MMLTLARFSGGRGMPLTMETFATMALAAIFVGAIVYFYGRQQPPE